MKLIYALKNYFDFFLKVTRWYPINEKSLKFSLSRMCAIHLMQLIKI